MHEALGLIPISSPPPTPKIVLIAQEVTVRSLASWLRVVSLGCLLAALRAHGGGELRGGPAPPALVDRKNEKLCVVLAGRLGLGCPASNHNSCLHTHTPQPGSGLHKGTCDCYLWQEAAYRQGVLNRHSAAHTSLSYLISALAQQLLELRGRR